jgi:hypothetical protein
MNYSPILAPVVILIIWRQVLWLAGFATLLRTITDDEFAKAWDMQPWKSVNHPVEFYALCTVTAMVGSGRGLDVWLAWIFALSWISNFLSKNWDSPLASGFVFSCWISFGLLAFHVFGQITYGLLMASG